MEYKLILKHISKYDSSITYSDHYISQLQNFPQERFSFYKETDTHFIFAKMVSSLQSLPYYQVLFNTFPTKEQLVVFLKSNQISEDPMIIQDKNILIYYMPYETLPLLKSKSELLPYISSIALDCHTDEILNSLIEWQLYRGYV